MVFRFGSQNPIEVQDGLGGGTWHHCEACVEGKQSHEELVAIGCIDLKLDPFARGLSGSAKIAKGLLGMCNRPLNKIGDCPN
jgi:hypothetical protein